MENSGLGFVETRTKKRILVVDDDEINREILGAYLEDEYIIDYATNGQETLDILHKDPTRYSLVLIDWRMPVMDGLTFLSIRKEEPALRRIPVIFLTSEKSKEVEALRLGAADFIKKPYRSPEVIQARVNRIVELREASDIVKQTSIDEETGLYTKEYFEHFVRAINASEHQRPYDLIAVYIQNHAFLQEFYGPSFMDSMNKMMGRFFLEEGFSADAPATRGGEETFFFFRPHNEDDEGFCARLLLKSHSLENGERAYFKVGVYPNADPTLAPSILCNRAISSYEAILKSQTVMVGHYDDALHEKSLLEERLIQRFPKAIEKQEFQVFYQPKYAIQDGVPHLGGAEALIRWFIPGEGMVNPGVFVPLFEKNGLIRDLDRHVHKQVANQIAKWKEEYEIPFPVSANLSRVDVLDPNLTDELFDIVTEAGIDPSDIHLEVTESAALDASVSLSEIVTKLKEKGFGIEVDDFGSGYSSLNTLTEFPFDVLKLDMSFMRRFDQGEKNKAMVKWIISLAKRFKLKTVAEGVETKEQYLFLVDAGCDYIQGWYFSKALPANEFEELIRKETRL